MIVINLVTPKAVAKKKLCLTNGVRLIALIVMNLVTPKAGAKHEPLINKPTSGGYFTRFQISIYFENALECVLHARLRTLEPYS
jgi:hypothetical protein